MSRVLTLALVLLLGACATEAPAVRDADRIARLRAAAGDPVRSIRVTGTVMSWTTAGDSVLAVWTRPREAWLMELSGRCMQLRGALSISFTNQNGRVTAGFDRVLVRTMRPDSAASTGGCRIREIRPLDVATLRGGESVPTAAPPEPEPAEPAETAAPGTR